MLHGAIYFQQLFFRFWVCLLLNNMIASHLYEMIQYLAQEKTNKQNKRKHLGTLYTHRMSTFLLTTENKELELRRFRRLVSTTVTHAKGQISLQLNVGSSKHFAFVFLIKRELTQKRRYTTSTKKTIISRRCYIKSESTMSIMIQQR